MIFKIAFEVLGEAKPAGSKRAFVPLGKDKQPYRRANGGVVVNVVDDNSKVKEWKGEVRRAARDAYRGELLRGAVRLTLRFVRVRPKGHCGTGRNAAVVKTSAPAWPITKPDCLKLTRGVEDALTGVVWVDDAQVVEHCLVKVWGEPARCEVIIEPLDPAEQAELERRFEELLQEKKPF